MRYCYDIEAVQDTLRDIIAKCNELDDALERAKASADEIEDAGLLEDDDVDAFDSFAEAVECALQNIEEAEERL